MSNNTTNYDDPWGEVMQPAEWATIAIFVIVTAVNLAGGIFAFYHRNYAPIKIRQVNLLLLALLSGVFWSLGTLAAQRALPQIYFPGFLVCDLWGAWFQVCFGAYLFFVVVIFRLWRLYAIVRLKFDASTWKFNLSFLILWTPTMLYGVILSATKALGPITVNEIYRCNFISWAKFLGLGILGLYLVLFLFFVVILRNIKQKYLREYAMGRNIGILFLVLYIIYVVLAVLNTQYYMWGRVIPVYMSFLPATLFFWATVGPAMYHCITDKEEYEKVFRLALQGQTSDKNQTGGSRSHKSPSATSPESTDLEVESQMKFIRSNSSTVDVELRSTSTGEI